MKRLGMEQYEPAFRENEIDEKLLSSLTAEDLKDLGVASVGHRRRLLAAIAALNQETPAIARDPSARASGERRQLTVMFCDLVGSTELAARTDPEDFRDVIAAYRCIVAHTIKNFDGFIAKYMGDGVIVYFGYPHAHEDDAEQAVRAGLALIDALGELQGPHRLQVRIGIATSVVVLGDLIGTGPGEEPASVGEAPNLSAQLQALAGSNAIVIAESTRRQIGTRFEVRDLGRQSLKGFAAQHVWRALRENRLLGRFEALRTGATPLIGRDEEVELLLRRWAQAKAGGGQVVLISGEPGVGKSRLVEELTGQIAPQPHIRLRYFCSPHHQDSALYPVIAQMERASGFSHDNSADEKLAKLRALLATAALPVEDVALIADLHLLSSVDLPLPLDTTPQRKKEKTFQALLRQVEGHLQQQPVLVVFEDIHWVDPSSREWLDLIIDRIANWPVLLLATFRPEFQPRWIAESHVTMLALTRLDQRDTAAMVSRIAGKNALPRGVLREIVERTDGVPLFVEELTNAVLESATQVALPAVSHSALTVPATLQASLMERLDRLGSVAKNLAQTGAAIGREFGYKLLTSVADLSGLQLDEALDCLTSSGLLLVRGIPPQTTYIFKHALVQDVAYSTLLRGRRQRVHARISKALEEQFPEDVATRPEILAHHFTEANLTDQAIEWWHRAGQRSLDRSALAEAGAHFQCALDLLQKLPPGERRDMQELDLTLLLAVPLIAVQGFGSMEVERCAIKAKGLSDKLPASPRRFAAHRLAWNSCLLRQPVPRTVGLARDLVDLSKQNESPATLAVARRALGYSLLIAGEFNRASEILARGAALADTIPDREFAVYGEHPSMVCRLYGGQADMTAGFPSSGARLVFEAVAHARRAENAHTLAWALAVAAHIFQISNDPANTAHFAAAAIEIAKDLNMPQWLGLGERCMGWAMHQRGDVVDGISLQQRGVRRWYDTGAKLHATHCEISLASSFLREGRTAAARQHLNAARAHSDSYGEAYLSAEIHRLEGLLLQVEQSDTEIVITCLEKSLSTARRQKARLLELRTATTLARILAANDRPGKAVNLLAAVYSNFTEGFDATDLIEARKLLDELGGGRGLSPTTVP